MSNHRRLANLSPPWKPGESGNPKGRVTGSKNLTTLLREAAEKRRLMGQDLPDMTAGEALAESMFYHAIKGNPAFAREILDRLEGRVPAAGPEPAETYDDIPDGEPDVEPRNGSAEGGVPE